MLRSLRVSEPPLRVWVAMRKDGSVAFGHCTCMAGLEESCSHVGATLWYIETGSRRNQERSVTDRPCYWFPDVKQQRHEKVRNMDFTSAAKRFRNIRQGHYDEVVKT